MSAKTWTIADLDAALHQFERDLRTSGYTDNTVFTYVDRSRRFVRYLEGLLDDPPLLDTDEKPESFQPDASVRGTAREVILAAIDEVAGASQDGTFSPKDVLAHLRAHGSKMKSSTVSTMIGHFMSVNATCESLMCPGTHTADLKRVSWGRYALNR